MRPLHAFVLLFYPLAVRGQATNAPISGRVTDPTKATVPDAKVATINNDTNFRYETATNGAGEYTLANLPPGTYQIEVEKTGFKKLVRPDVNLHVQDALSIDFEMAIGSVSDTVRVEAGAPLMNTTSATVSTVVDQTFVENMPLNGRYAASSAQILGHEFRSSFALDAKPIVFVHDGDASVRKSLELLICREAWRSEAFESALAFLARPPAMVPCCPRARRVSSRP